LAEETKSRIESEIEVKAYIQDLKFALNNGAKIDFQAKRLVDEKRDEKYTNQYTVNKLFSDENPVDALKRELLTLSVEDYMQTVKDIRFPKRSEMREFGKVYNGTDDVYIKIRVELLCMETQQLLLCHFILLRRHLHQKCFLIRRIRGCFHGYEDLKK